jgi:hypothetical protein
MKISRDMAEFRRFLDQTHPRFPELIVGAAAE